MISSKTPPIVIAHRGACGYVPEHTLASYFLAMEQGADYIEPDLVLTRDGVLVARHENEISGTTDVAARPEFASRKATRQVDGQAISGWFTEDFSWAELKTLQARERLSELRSANTRFDGMFSIPSFVEILALVRGVEQVRAAAARERGLPKPRRIGIYAETKHPSYFQQLGLGFDRPLLQTLRRFGYQAARDPIFIQSFEVANLRRLRRKTRLPLVQLIDSAGQPYDFALAGDTRSYADMMSAAGLREIASYANAIGPYKEMIVGREADGSLGRDTGLARRARRAGLGIHVWTLRAENHYLPLECRSSGDPSAHGDLATEIGALLDAGITGFFSDHPDIAVRARDGWLRHRRRRRAGG
jgi:glycerophosphoryl diester phosphodiesterase